MLRMLPFALFAAGAACLATLWGGEPTAAQEAARPPYVLHLRSRGGEVAPLREKDAQIAGGYVEVRQLTPDTLLAIMHGGVVAGSEKFKSGAASMRFRLHQEFDVMPTRAGLRPPKLSLAGVLIGTLQSSVKGGGSAEQAPANAAVSAAGQALLHVTLKPHVVHTAQKLLVNDREGPVEMIVAPGPFCFDQEFALAATQPYNGCLHHHLGAGAAANFDPEPRFEARYGSILKPFRAVPHRDFGFTVLIRVTESAAGEANVAPMPRAVERAVPPPPPIVPGGERKER